MQARYGEEARGAEHPAPGRPWARPDHRQPRKQRPRPRTEQREAEENALGETADLRGPWPQGSHSALLGNLKCHCAPPLRMGVHGPRSQLGLLLESTCVSGRPSDGTLTWGVGIICVRRDENKPLHLPPKSVPT